MDPESREKKAGRNCGSGRGADGRIDVELLETDPFLGQSVDIGRLGGFVAEAGKVSPSHVVDEDENDVGLGGAKGTGKQSREKKEFCG